MKLYGTILSPFVRKVIVVMNLKGLTFEHIDILPLDPSPDYLKLSPLGKIPAFEDGDAQMPDSSVICEYLDEQYPDTPVMPTTTVQRARSRWLEEFADTKLVELCAGGVFFERVVKPLMLQQETDQERVTNTIDNLLPPVLDYLETQIPEQGFLFGDIGTADIAVTGPIINAGYADFQVDSTRWPKLFAFVKRVKSHPAVSKALVAEAELVEQFKSQ